MDKARVFPNKYFKGLTKERRIPKRKVYRASEYKIIMIRPDGREVLLTAPKVKEPGECK